MASDAELWPIVSRLRCFRGVDTLTALALTCEVSDWHRFARAEQLAAWVGLVPSLSQSGESRTTGGITKTGSRHARRLLVEAAWHYQRPPRIGVSLHNRHQGQPDHILQIAWRAQHRVYRTHHRLHQRGKHPALATVAAARELACFLGGSHSPLTPGYTQPAAGTGAGHTSTAGTRDGSMGNPTATPVSRPRRPAPNKSHAVPNPRISD